MVDAIRGCNYSIIHYYVFYSHMENSLLLYLATSASCILTEPFFIYCNCLRNSVSYPHVNQNHVHVRFLRQETLYILSREWPYLSCTELVAKPFYLLLCSIIIFVCIIMFVKEMVIIYV